jgi:hypothetical protein
MPRRRRPSTAETYYARLRNPTPLSRAHLPEVSVTLAHHPARSSGAKATASVPPVLTVRGDVRIVRGVGGAEPGTDRPAAGRAGDRPGTRTEKELRRGADRQIEWAIAAFFWSVADAKTARDRHAPSGEIFALQHKRVEERFLRRQLIRP